MSLDNFLDEILAKPTKRAENQNTKDSGYTDMIPEHLIGGKLQIMCLNCTMESTITLRRDNIYHCNKCYSKLTPPFFSVQDTRQLSTKDKIEQVCSNLANFLKEKNKNYGDSATSPLNIFTGKTEPLGIGVRIDDKLSRIKNSEELRKNDVSDLLGYLVLLCASNSWLSFNELAD